MGVSFGQLCPSLLIHWHALYTLSTGKILNKCGWKRLRSVFQFVVWVGGFFGVYKNLSSLSFSLVSLFSCVFLSWVDFFFSCVHFEASV